MIKLEQKQLLNLKRKKKISISKKNQNFDTYYVAHPMIRSIVINKKKFQSIFILMRIKTKANTLINISSKLEYFMFQNHIFLLLVTDT